jgi:hypothetical protein
MSLTPSATPGPFGRKMNIVTVFEPERMLRTQQVTGTINLAGLRDVLQGLYTSKQFNPDLNALWDLRKADFSGILPEDVRELMHVVVSLWGRSGKCHSAVLVNTEAEFGVVRTYISQFGRNAPCKIRVFLDLNAARQWLGLGEAPGAAVSSTCRSDSLAGR